MSVKNLRIELGDMIRLTDAAPILGYSPRKLRELCDAGEIEHEKRPGKNGQGNRYFIPETAIRAYRRKHIRHAA